jgi:hypothetical protein
MQALFPTQYWPNTNGGTTNPPNVNCATVGSSSGSFTPAVDFVATQFTTQVQVSGEPGAGNPSPCDSPDALTRNGVNSNGCIQVIRQKPQQEINTYYPPLPLTIIGSSFGYLSGLPWVGTNPPNIVISDDGASNPSNPTPWSTNDGNLGNCQVYISDWTDGRISLQVGLPQSLTDNQGLVTLSPLTDMGPLTFFQLSSGTVNCPVSVNDNIQVTVINPQQPQNTPGKLAKPSGTTVLSILNTTPF